MSQDIIKRILAERERQFNLPGREFDIQNTPNDWAGIICSYATEGICRNHMKISRADFEDALI